MKFEEAFNLLTQRDQEGFRQQKAKYGSAGIRFMPDGTPRLATRKEMEGQLDRQVKAYRSKGAAADNTFNPYPGQEAEGLGHEY